MPSMSRVVLAVVLLAGLAGCAGQGAAPADALGALPADASLDARSLGRGAAAARPVSVQRRDDPASPIIVLTASPRLQTGSPNSLPMIVTSFGAERPRAGGAATFRALVVISNAQRFAGFARATTRQNVDIPLQAIGRETRCGAAGCLYEESVILTFPESMVRAAAEAGTPLRLRLTGGAAFVEAAIPPGHLRAVLEATDAPGSR